MAHSEAVSILFVGILGNHVIHDALFYFLSPQAMFRFALVCRAAHAALTGYYCRAFNIDNHLHRFFADPIAFRQLQARTGTLISGSSALQFLDRTFYPDSDLDLYTFPDQTHRVCSLLIEGEGYSLLPSSRNSGLSLGLADVDVPPWRAAFPRIDLVWSDMHTTEYRSASIGAVLSFEKEQVDGPPLRVQVISARNCPLQCILSFHSTCVMNFVSFDAAYSLYPRATFEHHIAVSFASDSPSDLEAVAKYALRGWKLISHSYPFHRCLKRRLFMPDEDRSPRDVNTWRVALDVDKLSLDAGDRELDALLHWDPTVYNSWRIENILTNDGGEMRMSYHVIKPSIFKYAYTLCDFRVVRSMLRFLRDQGILEHAKVAALEDDTSKWAAWRWWDASLPRLMDVPHLRDFLIAEGLLIV